MRNALPPHLAEEWDYTRNLDPSDPKVRSHDKVWWTCPAHENYSYLKSTDKRQRGDACPACSGRELLVGFNDLSTTHPELAAEWHPTKNYALSLTSIQQKFKDKVWWRCAKGHEWYVSVHNRARSGSKCPACTNRVIIPGDNDLATSHPQLSTEWHPTLNSDLSPNAVPYGSNLKVWWRCVKGHEWSVKVSDRATQETGCPSCGFRVSKPENELISFVQRILPTMQVKTAQRVIPSLFTNRKLELDVFIPELNIGIEFNGVYWHTEGNIGGSSRHQEKREAAASIGIQLITVWEDDWKYRRAIVERILKSRLGVLDLSRVYARNLTLSLISKDVADDFLRSYHIQGKSLGTVYLGGFHEGELVAVMVVRKRTEGEHELTRYATSKHVIGGHSKLLSWFAKNTDIVRLVTFADLDISTGALYEKTGWILDKELAPDYKYLVSGQRVHKFNYRLKRFREDPSLKYEEGLTERELAHLNGLQRVWDSGKKKYIFNFENN